MKNQVTAERRPVEVVARLVDARGLLETLFDESCRPSLRWVRDRQSDRSLPVVRIGRKVFFDVAEVRRALAGCRTVRARPAARRAKAAVASSDPVALPPVTLPMEASR